MCSPQWSPWKVRRRGRVAGFMLINIHLLPSPGPSTVPFSILLRKAIEKRALQHCLIKLRDVGQQVQVSLGTLSSEYEKGSNIPINYLSIFHFYILGVIKSNVSLRERWWHVVEEAKNWLALHFWKVSTFWSAGNRFLGDTAQHLRHSAIVCVLALSLPLFFFSW